MRMRGVDKCITDITRYEPVLSCACGYKQSVYRLTYLTSSAAAIQPFSTVKPGQYSNYWSLEVE
jgi:hypothetical protein